MPDVNRGNRPLSPHLRIYRPQITSITSIFTRITGNMLLVAALMVLVWFVGLAMGAQAYDTIDNVITSWFGLLVLWGSVWALWYHFLAGIRHLIWDSGRGLDLPTAQRLGWMAIIGSFVLTLLTIAWIYIN